MKKMRVAVALICSVATLFSAASCSLGSGSSSSGSGDGKGRVELWTKEGYVKIFQDREYESSYRNPLVVDISACKNEYEATQILLTALGGDVNEYNLELSDLKTADGKTFSKENIAVYNQKYMEVNSLGHNRECLGLGWYPDALLPFEKAVEHGENRVEEGCNQGIYIEAYIPKDAEAGIYTGNFTLTVDGVKHNVPATVTIYDYMVSEYNHFGSIFSTHMERGFIGEINSSEELSEKYKETLMEFRLVSTLSGGDNAGFIANVRKYCDPDQTPCTSAAGTIPIKALQKGDGIDEADFRSKLVALTAACLVDEEDYLSITDTRCGWIDEPHLNNTWDLVNTTSKSFNNARDTFAMDLESGEAYKEIKEAVQSVVGVEMTEEEFSARYEENKLKLAESARDIRNMITSQLDDRFDYDEVEAFVGGRVIGSTAKTRSAYNDLEADTWWYSCSGGSNKFALESFEAKLLEPRLVTWASFDYGYKGEIFWETVLYTKIGAHPITGARTEYAIDCYKEAVRCADDPGDGFFFYPGKPYGIFGPVTSLRLHAIRDGREEYEMLYDLEQKYMAKGYSPRSILEVIFNDLYCDLTLTSSADELFAQARKTLIELCLLADKGVFITDYEELGTQAKMKVRCEGESKLAKLNGEAQGEKTVYDVVRSLTGEENDFSFELVDGMNFEMSLGNKKTVVKNLSSISESAMSVIKRAELSNETIEGVNGVKVKLLPRESSEDFGDSSVLIPLSNTAFTKKNTSIALRVYNPNPKKMFAEITLQGSGGTALLGDQVINPGWNTLYFGQLASANWNNVKKLNGIRLAFSVSSHDSVADFNGVTVTQLIVEE